MGKNLNEFLEALETLKWTKGAVDHFLSCEYCITFIIMHMSLKNGNVEMVIKAANHFKKLGDRSEIERIIRETKEEPDDKE